MKIDFVLTVVFGDDPVWLAKKEKYLNKTDGNSIHHFRNWNNLKYWFRAVEKYASWVNKIYIITDHQIPTWLDVSNPKIVTVNHEDYLDINDLPVFNSNAIELKMHKIAGLSEYFVYFNDDVFLSDYVKPTDFFVDGLPCDSYGEKLLKTKSKDSFNYFLQNDMKIINKYFNKCDVYNNKTKYFNSLYLSDSIRTFLLKVYPKFMGFIDPHTATSYLKSSFDEVWDKESNILECTSKSRFRDKTNVNIYLIRYFRLMEGKFIPRSNNFGHYFGVYNHNHKLVNALLHHKYKIICINDDNLKVNFESARDEINKTLDYLLPNKSNFEI